MKIGALTIHDDSDILRANFNYHLNNGIDALAVILHQPTDKTVDILEDFKSHILLTDTIDEEAYHQHIWLARIRQKTIDAYALGHNDWFVHFDADEFWSGIEQLDYISDDYIAIKTLPWINYMPFSYDYHSIGKVDYINIDNKQPYTPLSKICSRAIKGLDTKMGNHMIADHIQGSVINSQITIDHFPIRTFEQFNRKIDRSLKSLKFIKSPNDKRCLHWQQWIQLNDREEYYLRNCSHIESNNSFKKSKINNNTKARLKRCSDYEYIWSN